MSATNSHQPAPQKPTAHEPNAINGRGIAIGGGLISSVLIVAGVAIFSGLRLWHLHREGANAALDIAIAGPRLLSAPLADRAAFAAEKQKLIDTYRWDGHSATAAIPIDVAIELEIEHAQRGQR